MSLLSPAFSPLALLLIAMPAGAQTGSGGAAQQLPTLATSKGCVACHDLDARKVGPSFREIAGRHGGQKDAANMLTGKVLNGSVGAWGPVAMPPNKAMGVTEAEAKQLVTWILTLKSPADTSRKQSGGNRDAR